MQKKLGRSGTVPEVMAKKRLRGHPNRTKEGNFGHLKMILPSFQLKSV